MPFAGGLICSKCAAAEVDTPFHPLYTSVSARVAAGSLIELADQVVEGSLHNGFALIRPPGKKMWVNFEAVF